MFGTLTEGSTVTSEGDGFEGVTPNTNDFFIHLT